MPDQHALFGDEIPPKPKDASSDEAPAPAEASPLKRRRTSGVQPARASADLIALSAALPPQLRMGTSSWHFPGWDGLVWDGDYAESKLSKEGLSAYSGHPLLRTVSLDRPFYRPLSASQYARYAAQVPDDFRFIVKAPSLVTDAQIRADNGRGMAPNPTFLNAELATREFIEPALEGLGHKIGALVFQISPLPYQLIARLPEVIARIGGMLSALPPLQPSAPEGVVGVEVRDAAFLSATNAPLLARILREARLSNPTTYCVGLHAKMPPIEDQLPILRALWPSPLVCRWNLHRRHGAFGYETAKQTYEPFNRMLDPDPETRATLARVIAGITRAGYPAYVTINNKAEGSAPLSVVSLAQALI